jgi:hypothetical protein
MRLPMLLRLSMPAAAIRSAMRKGRMGPMKMLSR